MAARIWGELSYFHGDILSALDGYRTALKILPKVIWLGFSAAFVRSLCLKQTQRF